MGRPTSGYKNAVGKRVPGVTTIIGRFKDSGGLLWWAFEQGKAAERGEISSLYDKRDEAAEAGGLAHDMVETHVLGKNAEDVIRGVSEEIATQARKGFEMYLQWQANSKIQILEMEMPLVSEKYQFGGTPDAVGTDSEGRLCLLDWKTSNGVYPDYLIQLAAYKTLWEEIYPDRPITGGFHLCRFSKEFADFAHHYYTDLSDGWRVFELYREAYDIDKVLKKRA